MKIKGCLKTLLVFAAGYAAGSIVMKLIDNRTMEQKIQDAVEEELAKLELNKKEIAEEPSNDAAIVDDDSDIYTPSDEEKVEYDEMIESYKQNIDKCVNSYVTRFVYDRDEDDSDTDIIIDMMAEAKEEAEAEAMTKQEDNNPYGKPATVPVILPPDVGERLENQAHKDNYYDVVEFLYFDGDGTILGSDDDILTQEDIKNYLGFVAPKKLATLPDDGTLYVKNDKYKLIIEIHVTKDAYSDYQ